MSVAGPGWQADRKACGLLRARILPGAEMVAAPQQARCLGLAAARCVGWIEPVAAFGHFVDDGQDLAAAYQMRRGGHVYVTLPLSICSPANAQTPSWMKSAGARVLGKRALYGIVAGTFALIGIAALVLQFATRSASRTPPAAASSAAALRAPTTPGTATTTAATSDASQADDSGGDDSSRATTPAAAVPRQRRTTARGDPARCRRVAHATPAPRRPGVAPTAPAPSATLASRTAPPAAPATPTAARGPGTAPAPVPAPAPAVAPASPVERQARCTEILQKASLEKITPAETDFFKRECK